MAPFRGGLIALVVAGFVRISIDVMPLLLAHAAIFGLATALMILSLRLFVGAVASNEVGSADVGILLGVQTTSALVSTPVWRWVGDTSGKLAMLRMVVIIRAVPPLVVLGLVRAGSGLIGFAILFGVIAAMMNGVTIGYLSYVMEISPDDRRSAYTAYFNTLATLAASLPLLGAELSR